MNKGLVFLSVSAMLMAVGCSQEQKAAAPTMPKQADVQQQAQAVAEQAKTVAAQSAQVVTAAKENVQAAQVNVQAAANNLSTQVEDLLAKAKEYVASGKLNEAIDMAQQVLKVDANNTDAKGIIEQAKAKLAELAQKKMGDMKANLLGGLAK